MNTIETDTHAPQATPQLPSAVVLKMMEVALEAARTITNAGNALYAEDSAVIRQNAAVLVTAILSAVDTLSRGNMSSLEKPDGS